MFPVIHSTYILKLLIEGEYSMHQGEKQAEDMQMFCNSLRTFPTQK